MYNLQLPVKHPEKVANVVVYVFVSESNVTAVSVLLDYGVLCIKPEFIGDFIIMVNFL